MANTITFSRSLNTYQSLETARLAIVGRAINLQYGEPIVAKYTDSNQVINLLFGIGTGDFNNPVVFIGTAGDTPEINERITNIENIVGSSDLNTVNKDLTGAVNELLGMIEQLGGQISVEDSDSISLLLSKGLLTAAVKISQDQGNAISLRSTGLYVNDPSEVINELREKLSDKLELIESSDDNIIVSSKSDGKQTLSLNVIDDSNTSDPDTAPDNKSLSVKATLNLIKNLEPGGEGGISSVVAGKGISVSTLSSSVTVSSKIDNNTIKFNDDDSLSIGVINGGLF